MKCGERSGLRRISVSVIILLLAFSIVPVLAQSFFDKTCDRCDGKGWIVCSECNGSGEVICSKCDGKGYYYEEQTCSTCGGDGEKTAHISRTDRDSDWVLHGPDWYLRVTGKFYNNENEGTYGTVYAVTRRYGEVYDEGRKRVWFSGRSHAEVTFDLDIKDDGADWTYNIYLESSDPITCPDCGGTGKIITKVTCEVCGGDGEVTCSTCGGDGRLTCPSCSGRGYVLDYGKIGGVALGGLFVLGIAFFALSSMSGRPTASQPTVSSPSVEVSFKPPPASGKIVNLVEERQKYQNFVKGLKEQLSSGEINEKTFKELNSEYQEKLKDIKKQTSEMKKQLRKEIRSLKKKRRPLSDELEKLETRFKLSEINNAQFEEKSSGLKTELKNIDTELTANESDLKIL